MQIEQCISSSTTGNKNNITQIIISYFFTEYKRKNHCLEYVVKALSAIRLPKSSVELKKPFPLNCIVCPFQSEFYCHLGSPRCNPDTKSSIWSWLFPSKRSSHNNCLHIFQTDTIIPIGYEQMKEFRKLCGLKEIALEDKQKMVNDESQRNKIVVRLNRYNGRRRNKRNC